MSYQLGADDPDVIARIDARTAELVELQKQEAQQRRLSLLITIGGALFAFVRLGIIALPHIRGRAVGKLADPLPLARANPARRRRRRRR